MTVVLKTDWKKCGNYRLRTLVKVSTPSAIRQAWFRRIVTSSSREDQPDSSPNGS